MSEIKDYAIKCFQDEAQAILDLIPLLTDDFDKAIDLIYHSRGKLVVTGVGKSGHCGAKIAATLASTGTPSFFITELRFYTYPLRSSQDTYLYSNVSAYFLRIHPVARTEVRKAYRR